MILIGKLDSPYVRRVAVSMTLLGVSFERRDWSVGPDQARIREYNPLGRSPTLVLDDGEVLVESGAILDYLDERAGPDRALLPPSGDARRTALQVMALATGAAEKGLQLVYERAFRPAEKSHEPWLARCREQMLGAYAGLERRCAAKAGEWLLGPRMTQADITLTSVSTFLADAVKLDLPRYPAVAKHVQQCEALPVFREIRAPFFSPDSTQKAPA